MKVESVLTKKELIFIKFSLAGLKQSTIVLVFFISLGLFLIIYAIQTNRIVWFDSLNWLPQPRV